MKILNHKFVEKIPIVIEEGILYISIPCETAIHKCCCGCGNEVVTPFARTQWSFTFDGESITLNPSIGSWSLKCRSHYIIEKNNVVWLRSYNRAEIEKVRKVDFEDNLEYYEGRNKKADKKAVKKKPFWKLFFSRWLGK